MWIVWSKPYRFCIVTYFTSRSVRNSLVSSPCLQKITDIICKIEIGKSEICFSFPGVVLRYFLVKTQILKSKNVHFMTQVR